MAEKAKRAVPEGMNTVTASLWFEGKCRYAIDYYKKVFNAELLFPPYPFPESDRVMHAMIKVGNTNLMMGDTYPGCSEKGAEEGTTVGFFVYVDDCDALFNKAVEEGCVVVDEMMDAFWGDRMGKVKDPFGHMWSIASHKWNLSDDEMVNRQKEWLEGMGI